MARIWNDIEIDWKGETYTLRPSIEFINYLEQGPGNSISMLYGRASQGDLPTGKGCEVIAKCLRYTGAKKVADVTPEDVLEETAGVGVDFITLVCSILLACMPEPKKKTPLKKKPSTRSPAKKSTRKRTGPNSTG